MKSTKLKWYCFVQALQSVGQIVGEVLRQLTEEKFIVKVWSSVSEPPTFYVLTSEVPSLGLLFI